MNKRSLFYIVLFAFINIQVSFGENRPDAVSIAKFIRSRGKEYSEGKLAESIRTTDANNDGLLDRLVPYDCGVHGHCLTILLVQQRDGSFHDYGDVDYQVGATTLLKSKHKGFFDMITYNRFGISDGVLNRQEFSGRTYKVVKSLGIEQKDGKDVNSIFDILGDSTEQENAVAQQAAR